MTAMYDVRINNLAYGGDGIGKLPDGRVVFVPYTIPGELARITLTEEKPRHARGELVELLESSPARVIPRCRHFTTCGGCHYQHMEYAAQVKAKSAILREQLERMGGLRDVPEIEIIAAAEPWYYRNTVQFHITRDGKLGYQRANSQHTFAIQECHLPEASINQLWPQVEVEPIPGLERVGLRAGADGDLMLILESSQPLPLEFEVENLAISVVQLSEADSTVLAGSESIEMEVRGRRFTVSAGSFFQVNTNQAQAMVANLLDLLQLDKRMAVLDVYCGAGLFSAFLAPMVKRLVGIEISPAACEDYGTNLDEFDNVELYEDSAENVLSQVSFSPDVMVMDPPRAGLGAKTVQAMLNQGATQLAYISCDPATLARDARQLSEGGYSLARLIMLDMFPQTYHIESISKWERHI